MMRQKLKRKQQIVEKKSVYQPYGRNFYKSSAPGNPAFIEAGMNVSVGDTLCIIEAMKLMNEVKATKNCKNCKNSSRRWSNS